MNKNSLIGSILIAAIVIWWMTMSSNNAKQQAEAQAKEKEAAAAMEAALRRYNGKAMINSVNGKKESMETVFPLLKEWGRDPENLSGLYPTLKSFNAGIAITF